MEKCNSAGLIIVASVCVVICGCGGGVQRELTICTEPSDALVVINDEEIGFSPVTVSFNWYGDYSIRISKPGYKTLKTHWDLKGPWYDAFPIDFFADLLWPGCTVDSHECTFKLTLYEEPGREKLIRAAEEMKSKAVIELAQPVQD